MMRIRIKMMLDNKRNFDIKRKETQDLGEVSLDEAINFTFY